MKKENVKLQQMSMEETKAYQEYKSSGTKKQLIMVIVMVPVLAVMICVASMYMLEKYRMLFLIGGLILGEAGLAVQIYACRRKLKAVQQMPGKPYEFAVVESEPGKKVVLERGDAEEHSYTFQNGSHNPYGLGQKVMLVYVPEHDEILSALLADWEKNKGK